MMSSIFVFLIPLPCQSGITPLFSVNWRTSQSILSILLEYGANYNPRIPAKEVQDDTSLTYSPYHDIICIRSSPLMMALMMLHKKFY
jgi:uncharacterized membrane protein